MKVRICPSVASTTWKDDFKFFGLPKRILNISSKYWKHIGLYDLTIEKLAELANSSDKKKGFKTYRDFKQSGFTKK
jgi:hypothetical protein